MRSLILLLFVPLLATSEEISFLFAGAGTGSLNGISFSGNFEVFGTFNPDNITQSSIGFPGVLGALNDSAFAILPNSTTVSFSGPTYIFNSPDPTDTGMADAYLMGFGGGPWPGIAANEPGDLLAIRGFESYELTQAFRTQTSAPNWGYIEEFNVPAHPVLTSGGLLIMDDETESLTLSQIIVPEPSAWILFMIGWPLFAIAFHRIAGNK